MLRRRAASTLLHPAPPESFRSTISATTTGQSMGMGLGGDAVVGEGDTVGVGKVRCVERGVFFAENGVDGATCLGAGVIGSENTASGAEGEVANRST